ncbi:hypothetical protein K502DRAFT_344455 [Neoconidiobolus thromboides FSU 785]|nr:hypothetical protein K502DRAFT_344455 [Neoconidiobolus thromboides FSU 785]
MIMTLADTNKENSHGSSYSVSSFGSNFLSPHKHRKSKHQKEIEAKKLALNVKEILLDTSDDIKTQKTVRALQDPRTLEKVFDILKCTPSLQKSSYQKILKKVNSIPKVENESSIIIKEKTTLNKKKNNTRSNVATFNKKPFDLSKKSKRTRKANKQSKVNPKIAELASFFEKDNKSLSIKSFEHMKKTKNDTKPTAYKKEDKNGSNRKINVKTEDEPMEKFKVELDSIIPDILINERKAVKNNNKLKEEDKDPSSMVSDNKETPVVLIDEKRITNNIDDIKQENSNSSSTIVDHLNIKIDEGDSSIISELSSEYTTFSNNDADDDMKSEGELRSISEPSLSGITLKESHILRDSYAKQLRRRHAMKRNKICSTSSLCSPVPTFDSSLPLDDKTNFVNPLKKYFGLLSPSKGNKKKPDISCYDHHLQRAYLPVELIENIPISEQVKVFINKDEVEAYRKSGMTHLDINIISQDKGSMPGLLSSAHDIWYEDLSPPKDGVSVYVYWWGYEVYVPAKVLEQLRKQGSTTTSIISFITAITTAVPLIQPILKILSAFISMESSASDLFRSDIGTVLTATWILPFLVIPRAWN